MSDEEKDPLTDPDRPAKDRLVALIEDIRNRLHELVLAKYVLFHEEVRDAIQAAYDEEIGERKIQALTSELEKLEDTSALENAGLTDKSLHMKLLEYNHVRNKFRKKGGIKTAKELTEVIHILLGSILTVTNVAEPVKEFVELIKLVMSEAES